MGAYCQYIPMVYWPCPIYLNATKSLSNIFPRSLSNIFSRSLSNIFPCYKDHVQYIAMLQGPCATRRCPAPSWSKVKHPKSYYRIGVEPQRVTGIPVPGNSRENQPNFFPLDPEKSFSISRSRLETRD